MPTTRSATAHSPYTARSPSKTAWPNADLEALRAGRDDLAGAVRLGAFEKRIVRRSPFPRRGRLARSGVRKPAVRGPHNGESREQRCFTLAAPCGRRRQSRRRQEEHQELAGHAVGYAVRARELKTENRSGAASAAAAPGTQLRPVKRGRPRSPPRAVLMHRSARFRGQGWSRLSGAVLDRSNGRRRAEHHGIKRQVVSRARLAAKVGKEADGDHDADNDEEGYLHLEAFWGAPSRLHEAAAGCNRNYPEKGFINHVRSRHSPQVASERRMVRPRAVLRAG